MFAPAKSLTLYKDFNKDAKDMLTKSYSDAQKWKVECKYKGPKDTFFVNPTATSDGKFSADLEYVPSQCGAAVKVTFLPSTCNAKITASYQDRGHKVEGIVSKQGEYEVSHECRLQGRFSSHTKLVKNSVDVGFGLAVGPHCEVGCGAVYTVGMKTLNSWSMAGRFGCGCCTASLCVKDLKTAKTNVMMPLRMCPHPMRVGAEVECGHGKGWTGTFGVEAACVLVKGNTLKARVNKNKEWAVAYIAKLADNWTAAITLDKNLKPGVLLTHS
ncbi:putative voltage-dependent anion-selective channel [Trypanosoma theileri]|uniref:Putative voltage-dependent anion-selective channel n=2 Tax=Trypanosoma theileri TaxID=67003 RepID=A0A1X0NJX9_9TRYP|nr:putative voltage-dependent anion-selective channel [Trypanosoma theileri]ORC84986.1 putative voltage-dependent anion-selective channel [Trypanosoma theileri]